MKKLYSPEENAEYQQRHRQLVENLLVLGISQYVMTEPDSIFYMTGASYDGLERPFFLLVGADGSRRLIVPLLEEEHMKKAWACSGQQLLTYQEFPAPAGVGWQDVLFNQSCLNQSFGFEAACSHALAAPLLNAGGRPLDLIGELRLIKSAWEIRQIERAAHYADWCVGQIIAQAYNGATVAETYLHSQKLLRKIIRETPDWDPLTTKVIGAAWPAPVSAEPHSVPGIDLRLESGPHVAMVLTRVNGYAAESERSFFTSPPNPEQKALFELMLHARQTAFAMIRPGVPCAAIDDAVNQLLAGAGFDHFKTRLHRCGHGFGLDNHERPWIASGSRDILQANMVISIEPGIYVAGTGGFRHSDTILVTEDAYRCLTRAPHQLKDLVRPRPGLRARLTGMMVRRSLGI